jgi:hypothetical protein
VHELEAELVKVRAHLDQLLEMPDDAAPSLPTKHLEVTLQQLPEPVASNGDAKTDGKTPPRKRVSLTPAVANGSTETEPSQAPVQEP